MFFGLSSSSPLFIIYCFTQWRSRSCHKKQIAELSNTYREKLHSIADSIFCHFMPLFEVLVNWVWMGSPLQINTKKKAAALEYVFILPDQTFGFYFFKTCLEIWNTFFVPWKNSSTKVLGFTWYILQ